MKLTLALLTLALAIPASATTLNLTPHVCANLTQNCVAPTDADGVYAWANANFALVIGADVPECQSVDSYSVTWTGDNFTVVEDCDAITIIENGYRFKTRGGSGRGGGYPGTRYQITDGTVSY